MRQRRSGSLATHTSGLPRIPGELRPKALARHPDPYADLDHDALVTSLARQRTRPRRRPRYSNLGVGLLGHALACHAGAGYDALVQARVTGPLGMTATGCEPAEEPVGHRRRGTPYDTTWHFDALAGCGALWSTLSDVQRFLTAQLEPPAAGSGRRSGSPAAAGHRSPDRRLPGLDAAARDATGALLLARRAAPLG